jgi:ribosome biogenesis GTPase A
VDLFKALDGSDPQHSYRGILSDRYGIPLAAQTGETFLQELGDQRYQGDRERAARTLLNDYRIGNMGSLPLEWPPIE